MLAAICAGDDIGLCPLFAESLEGANVPLSGVRIERGVGGVLGRSL